MTPRSALQPVPVLDGRGSLCREVLESLPAWFGIPEAIESYVAKRVFYQAVGFLPIEEFPDLWGAEYPCLLMLRPLSNRA